MRKKNVNIIKESNLALPKSIRKLIDEENGKEKNKEIDDIKQNIEIHPVEKKHQNKRIILVTIGVVIIFIVIALLTLFYGKNSKTLVLYAVNQEYADFVSMTNHFFKNSLMEEASSSTLKTKGSLNFKVNSEDESLKELEKYTFDYEIANDYQNKELLYQIQTFYDQKSLVDFRTYGTKKRLYLELKDLFSKYISIELEEYNQLFENSDAKREDVEYILQSTKNLALESLREEDFKKSREKITLDNKEVSTSKITYEMNEEVFKRNYEYIISGIIQDEKYLEILAKYSKKDIKEIKKSLTDVKNKIPNNTYLRDEEIKFVIYFEPYFNEPLKYEFTWKENKIEYFTQNENKKIEFYQNNQKVLTANMKRNEILFECNKNETQMSGSLKQNDKKLELYLQLRGSENIQFNVISEQKDKYNGNVSITLKSGLEEIKVDGKYQNVIGEKIELPKDLEENSISYDQITEEHFEEIIENLSKNEVFMELFGTELLDSEI